MSKNCFNAPRFTSGLWWIAVIGLLFIVVGCSALTGGQKRYAAKICDGTHDKNSFKAAAPDANNSAASHHQAGKSKPALGVQDTKLDAVLKAELDRRHILGGAIAIVRKGKIHFAKAYGPTNMETTDPITLNTRFWIGSITKQFTAMAVMMLVEQGRVALDDKASKYLPELPPSYDAIKVRHLLTHTSGIKRDFRRKSCPPFASESMTGSALFEALKDAKLEYVPGTKRKYTNAGYVLLGMLIQQVSGKRYPDFLKTHIFDPLGMTETRSVGPEDVALERLAVGHEWQDKERRHRSMAPILGFSEGSIISTIVDMAKWDAALYTDALVSLATLRQIWTPHILKNGKTASFGIDDQGIHYKIGFGWFVNDEPGNLIVHHGGNLDGNAAHIDRYVDEELTIIVLINTEPSAIARGIARIVAFYHDHHMKSKHLK